MIDQGEETIEINAIELKLHLKIEMGGFLSVLYFQPNSGNFADNPSA